MHKPLIALLLAVPLFAAATEVHICTDASGKKTFQQVPCESGVESEVKNYSLDYIGTNMGRLDYDQARAEREGRQLQRDIRRSENTIVDHQNALTRELAALRQRQSRANNNLAGATYLDSISNEMKAVTARWDTMIRESSRGSIIYLIRLSQGIKMLCIYSISR